VRYDRILRIIYIFILQEQSMIEGMKPLLNTVLLPLARPLVRIGIRPNHLTVIGLALSGCAAWSAFTGRWNAACIITMVAALFDALDGMVARESGQKSSFGAILDSNCDRLSEIFLICGVLGYYLTSLIPSLDREVHSLSLRSWGIFFCYCAVTLSLMVSYVKARCEGAGVSCGRGILQRPERIILLCAGLLAGPSAMAWILGLISILAAVTILQRFIEAYQKSKSR
jgi:CDP-diacylglycerol---glycerol-3-phosphate 3-phosphatidyltransferase